MKLFTATLVATIGLGLCAAPRTFASDDSFVGNWKFNQEKSTLNGLTYKVGQTGKDQYTFTFGDDTEALTLGKEHKTKYGNTWLVTQSGPNAWKWVQKRDGKVTSDAMWTVSDDGATSTYVSTETRADGSTSDDTTKLKRTAGKGSGLAGTWESTEIKVGSPVVMEMASWGRRWLLDEECHQHVHDRLQTRRQSLHAEGAASGQRHDGFWQGFRCPQDEAYL